MAEGTQVVENGTEGMPAGGNGGAVGAGVGCARFPIRAVSRLTGITIDTLRAWERRYGAVIPGRDKRGRSYDQTQIRRLILLRDAVQRGHAIGQVAALDEKQLEQLLSAKPIPAVPSPSFGRTVPLYDRVLAAIDHYDYPLAEAEMGKLAALLTCRQLVFEAVLPLLRTVGERWSRGQFSLAQEHMISSIVRNLLGSILRLYQPSRPGARLIVATLSGELHEFGALTSVVLAVGAGIEAIYMGPNVPSEDLVTAAEHVSPRAVVLGATCESSASRLAEEVAFVRSRLHEDCTIWLGGQGALRSAARLQAPGVRIFATLEEAETELAAFRASTV